MKTRESNGITLTSLVVTIVMLVIIAGISIYSGKATIKKARLEGLKTNMLLIQAKAKEYVEEANFKIGKNTDKVEKVREDVYEDKCGLEKAIKENIQSIGNTRDN